MACIVRCEVRGNGSKPRDFELEGDGEVRIGRAADCDLVLSNRTVSREHCRLFARDDRIYVEDLGSTKGTRLNGEPVSVELIEERAELALGEVTLDIAVGSFRKAPPRGRSTGSDSGLSREGAGAAPPASEIDACEREVTTVGGAGSGRPKEDLVIRLGVEPITIGRDSRLADVRILDLNISRAHCRLTPRGDRIYVADLGSSNGTFINGAGVSRERELCEGDILGLGRYRLLLEGGELRSVSLGKGLAISAAEIAVRNPRPSAGQPEWILREVSFTIRSGEFVGLLGTSGAGKSTLLRAISGRLAASDGQVTYDAESLAEQFDSFRSSIGYAPQKDIFHEDLTLVQALTYASQLRLPSDVSESEIEENVDRVVGLVGLDDRKTTIIRNLSGGQKRRLTIAMELLGSPRVLFLDEVTSGLDPFLEEQMMALFRRLSDEEGMTIVIITHHANSAELCDKMVYLNKGRLTFFGRPEEAKRFFGVESFERIYRVEARKSPEEWREEYEASSGFRVHAEQSERLRITKGLGRLDLVRQCGVLVRRNVRVFLADKLNVMVLGLGPAVAYLLCMLASAESVSDAATHAGKQFKLCVGSTVIMYFLGIFGSVREIVKELEIYHHEHFSTVEILPYVASKLIPLAMLGAVQTAGVGWILTEYGGMAVSGPVLHFYGLLFLTYLAAMTTGLAVSAAVRTSDLAIMIMLFLVIPQVLLGGGISGPKWPPGNVETLAAALVTDYWSLEGAKALVAPYQNVSVAPILVSKGLAKSCWMLFLHGLAAFAATVALMVRKDGPLAGSSLRRVLSGASGRGQV